MTEPIYITGMGVVSCLGPDLSTFWERLIAGESGIGPITRFEVEGLRNPEAGQIRDYPTAALPDWASGLDEAIRYALWAALEAAASARLPVPGSSHAANRASSQPAAAQSPFQQAGIVLATNFGGAGTLQRWASQHPAVDGRDFYNSLMSTATDALAALLGATGPRASLSLSCSSGAAAIGMAAEWIRLGKADRVLAGGYDALTLYSLAGLNCLRTVTTGKLRPFDKNRSGTVFGDGAGIVVLESASAAADRGAQPLARLTGWATNNNAHHLTAPESSGAGLLHVMEAACRDAGIDPATIDYVNAHGTGTRYNDPAETHALHALMGEHAREVPVSSIKAAISHTMGAAGAIEAIATVMAIRTGILPPTINWEERDPECDLDYVPNQSRPHLVRRALTVSSGIGGNNAALALEHVGAAAPGVG